MFYDDSTARFGEAHGLGESYYIICPVASFAYRFVLALFDQIDP